VQGSADGLALVGDPYQIKIQIKKEAQGVKLTSLTVQILAIESLNQY